MNWTRKITEVFKKKDSGVEYGGFDLLRRLTGFSYTPKAMLDQYEKSLYVYACVSKMAEKTASIDYRLFQIVNSSGDTKELPMHPALDLIYKPNPFQTKSEFRKISVINLKMAGDAFWYKVRNDRGQVAELWNLRPDCVEILKDPELFIKGYRFTKPDSGEMVTLAPEDVVHFKMPTPLQDYYGVSPIMSAQVRIQTEDLASQYQRDFFLNSARPDAILKFPNILHKDRKEEIRAEFENRHKGRGRNSKIGIFDQGLEYQQIAISQREMDYIESMKFTRDDILVAFHTPKPIVAITDDVNRANAETAMFIYQSETIKPLVAMMNEVINEMLIMPDFGENLYLDFVDPTPENREQIINEYNLGTNKWLLINEVRYRENLEPIDGGWDLWQPISNIPTGGISSKAVKIGGLSLKEISAKRQSIDREKQEKERIRKARLFMGRKALYQRFIIVEDFIKQLKNLETKSDGKELKPLIKGDDLRNKYADMILKAVDTRAERLKSKTIDETIHQKNRLLVKLNNMDLTKAIGGDAKTAIGDFYQAENGVMAKFVFPFIEEYVRQAGLEAMSMVNQDKDFIMTDRIRKVLEKRAKDFGLSVNDTTRDKITSAISEGLANGEGMTAISDRINTVYSEFSTYRADRIARTESTAANNEGFLEAYKQSEVATHKEWIATLDDRTRDEHIAMNGEIVKVNDRFSNGLAYPQEPNCRCVLGPAFED